MHLFILYHDSKIFELPTRTRFPLVDFHVVDHHININTKLGLLGLGMLRRLMSKNFPRFNGYRAMSLLVQRTLLVNTDTY